MTTSSLAYQEWWFRFNDCSHNSSFCFPPKLGSHIVHITSAFSRDERGNHQFTTQQSACWFNCLRPLQLFLQINFCQIWSWIMLNCSTGSTETITNPRYKNLWIISVHLEIDLAFNHRKDRVQKHDYLQSHPFQHLHYLPKNLIWQR